jgi:hypothetical protein
MARKYSYYPSFDGGKAQEGTLKLVDLCKKRWKCGSLGVYQVRLMKNDKTVGMKLTDPDAGKWMSTHATGAAADISYPSEKVAREMWDWFLGSSVIDGKKVEHSEVLGIEEIHWYAFGDFGCGYRCSRGEGKKGSKIFTKSDNAGSYQGNPMWLHVEISPEMAKDAAKFEAAWRSLPKPNAA